MQIYCNSLTEYNRLKSREVKVGSVGIGGNNPIRVQSMTTTDTMDTQATVEQTIRMVESGCELVRITAPSKKEAENLGVIKAELLKRGYDVPLIADIHYTPNAAEVAARLIEKVRVNPGNYVDKKKFDFIEYTDAQYQAEIDKIREKFTPLVKICKEHETAMRIGTNHGSLSDRILSRYGDTPLGMVESALEFLRICQDEDYHNIILSMKSSNTQVMVQAYRLLVQKMQAEGMNYPLHLGVTEAGEGEDGRIKSAVGIGTLLEDGIGDTIRVSLTEDPEFEAPVAKILADRYNNRIAEQAVIPKITDYHINPFEYHKRATHEVVNIGFENVPRVVADFSGKEKITPASLFAVGYNYSVSLDKWNLSDTACDYVYIGSKTIDFDIPGTLGIIQDVSIWKDATRHYPLLDVNQYLIGGSLSNTLNFITVKLDDLTSAFIAAIKTDSTVVLLLSTNNANGVAEQRRAFVKLMNNNCNTPVITKRSYNNLDEATFQLYAATDLGALLIDGLSDGIMISASNCGGTQVVNKTAFGLLQASRTRISKTEYISCPSCGRTLFDLQETTAKIRKRTDHLKGVKIGIMGCIVNGPGEMADADFGYVGTGVGKITLYKGQEVVKRNIPSEDAVDQLIQLIKDNDRWIEKT
jgi:(E)-4-hydroxy-3-methylbut-2-enyl-diphosphate synthase